MNDALEHGVRGSCSGALSLESTRGNQQLSEHQLGNEAGAGINSTAGAVLGLH